MIERHYKANRNDAGNAVWTQCGGALLLWEMSMSQITFSQTEK